MTKPGFVEIEAKRIRICQDHQTRSMLDMSLSKFDVEKQCDESATETIARFLIEQDVVQKRRVEDDDGTIHMYYYVQVIMPPPPPLILIEGGKNNG